MKYECMVCLKMFTRSPPKATYKKGNYEVISSEDMICSEKCRQIHEQTMNNEQRHCYYCKRKLGKKEERAWHTNYEKRIAMPICDKCLYK